MTTDDNLDGALWRSPVTERTMASLSLTKAEMEAIRFAADMVDTARDGAEEEATARSGVAKGRGS